MAFIFSIVPEYQRLVRFTLGRYDGTPRGPGWVWVMQVKLDEVTERWGVKVNAVEIREITPPKDIQDAMSRQMSAERHRRAVVLEAEGTREAAVTIANGNRDAAILNAEGQKQSVIL